MRFATSIAITGLLALGGSALAEGLNTSWLPPNVQWVAHLDAEAFFASEIGQAMTENGGLELGDIDFDELEELGINVETDLHGITIYSPGKGGQIAILSLADSVDLEAILDTAQAEHPDEHRIVIIDDILLHVWGDEIATFVATEGPKRFIVISDSDTLVAGAVKVIHGDAKSHRDADEPALKLDPPRGAIAFGAVASASSLPDMDVASEVIKHAKAFSASLAEREDAVEIVISMQAKSREQARDITDVLNGMLALVRLSAEENEWFGQIAQLTRDTAVSRDGRMIIITLRAENEMILHVIGMLAEH